MFICCTDFENDDEEEDDYEEEEESAGDTNYDGMEVHEGANQSFYLFL